MTDRRRYEIFEQSKSGGIIDFAKAKVKQILDEHKPLPLPSGAGEKINAIVKRAQGR